MIEKKEYNIEIPGIFNMGVLKSYQREFADLGFRGGAQSAKGEFIYCGANDARVYVKPPTNSSESASLRFIVEKDSPLAEELKDIVKRVGGRV